MVAALPAFGVLLLGPLLLGLVDGLLQFYLHEQVTAGAWRESFECRQLERVLVLYDPGFGYFRGFFVWKDGDELWHLDGVAGSHLVLQDEFADVHAVVGCWSIDDWQPCLQTHAVWVCRPRLWRGSVEDFDVHRLF